MLKIINLSTYNYDMDRYNNNYKNVKKFLENHNIDAIELLAPLGYSEELIPKNKIKGIHLKHFPIWLDFWNGNKKGMLEDFDSEKDLINNYGGDNKKAIINQYKEEIKIAEGLNAEYVVFHVSNVKLKHCYNYNFTYTDKDVIDATIELVNEIFKDLDTDVTILFENLWWPGLRMVNKELAKYFIENIGKFVNQLIAEVPKQIESLTIEAEQFKPAVAKDIVTCPTCKEGKIGLRKNFYGCSNYKNGCKQTLPVRLLGKKLTEKNINDLCKIGKTAMIKGFKSKNGKQFNASLRLVEGKIEFEFNEK